VPLRRVLRTRLLPPRVPNGSLPRAGLVERVVRGLRGRLVVVSAGPGYGKSTLMAQALRRVESPWVWCSVDERIAAPTPLLAHLTAGLQVRFPGFGAGMSFSGAPEEQVRELANEVVSTVPEDVVLVLDDVHELRSPEAVETLDLLAHDLPPQVHLALVGRSAPPLALGRLRPAGVLQVGEPDLALSAEESAELAGSLGVPLEPDALARLHDLTEGWMTGLLLAVRSGAAAAPVTPEVIDYLAEEVLARLPAEARAFVADTAILERFTPGVAAAVTGRSDARAMIERLVDDHVFAVRLDAEREWYRYHHMFQAVLRRQAAREGSGHVSALHRRAADAWLERGEPDEAVRHFIAAGDMAGAVKALEPMADRMLGASESEALVAWLEAIPPELWSDCPGLVLAQASELFSRAQFPEAFASLERALDELVAGGQHERAAVALFRYLRALAAAGGLQGRGIAAARRNLAHIHPDARMLPAARMALAALYAQDADYEEAEAELAASAHAAAAARSSVLEAYVTATRAFEVDHPRGASERALEGLAAAIAELERRPADDELTLLPFAHAYRAVVLNDLGRHEEALAEAARLRDASDRLGFGRLAVPVVSWLRLDALGAMGRWAQLGTELALTTPVFQRLGSAVRGFLYDVAGARLAAASGDARSVAARVSSARAGLRAHAHPFVEAGALTDLAAAAGAAGLHDEARGLVADALAAARAAQAPWAEGRAALVGADLHGPGAEGDELLHRALSVGTGGTLDELWTRRERQRTPGLLARALRDGLGPEDEAARLVAACGGDVPGRVAAQLAEAEAPVRARLAAALRDAPGAADAVAALRDDSDPIVRRAAGGDAPARAPLRLVTLGGFAVWRDGAPIPDAAFERQKARALLALLACAGGAVHRESLVESLWPALAPERGLAALYSTLYVLRRAIEPGLARGAASSLVAAEGPTYRLTLTADDEWDAAVFLTRARAALEPGADLETLLAAERAHTGPLLPEWPYAEWAAPLRTEVEEAHRRLLEGLAEGFAGAGRPTEAIARYRRLLALEPEREGWHRALMRVYGQAGERALALRQYHACRALLRQRLGVEPSRETRALYSALLSDAG
jgi:DNA-binding SARP family transcriptional activator